MEWDRAMVMLEHRLNPSRRNRSNPRVIKRKIMKWPVKRFCHYNLPQPEYRPEVLVLLN
jgi:hypothetical protein